jgi:oxysterol-binding protein-related protein 9/10/11
LLVLKWFLAALKQQQYAGRDEKDGVKKPLNAFLGELFLASWDGGEEGVKGTTRLVSEQVRWASQPLFMLHFLVESFGLTDV